MDRCGTLFITAPLRLTLRVQRLGVTWSGLALAAARGRPADLRVERPMVGNVVAMPAACPRLEVRRCVAMGDAQLAQVGHDGAGVPERETGVELQAVSRFAEALALGQEISRLLEQVFDG